MQKCQRCRDDKGDYLCRHDVVGTPREDQEIIGYSEVKEALLRLVRDSFQRSKDPNIIANLSAALIGDFGMGKSAIARFFVNAINELNYEIVLVNLLEDGLLQEDLQHFDSQQMATYRGVAIRIDARAVADQLQRGQVTDYMTPFFRKIGDEFDIPRERTSVKEITEAILEKKQASRLFVFIDEMEGLKETQYGLDFDEFFAQFTNDLRTLINGEGMYEVRNCITIVLCTVPNVWDEFRRREDIAGGLLSREYSEPFVLQRFTLPQSYRFVERVCRSWENCPLDARYVRALHLAADGKPRLLTKLCKHVEGTLPAGDARSSQNYDLAALTAIALDRAVGAREQFTYAFDSNSFTAIYEFLDREYSSEHANLFRQLAMQYGEYGDEELAKALELGITRVQEIVSDLSDETRPILGLRLVSKGHLFDQAVLASAKVPENMVDQRFLRAEDVDASSVTGEITIFGKLDYFDQILARLTTEMASDEKQVFVSFHKNDLALLWNLSDGQADTLGRGLRGCALQRGNLRYKLSETARNRVFPVASQADLPFLSKEQYYQLRNKANSLDPESRNAHMVGGVLKLFEAREFGIQERSSADFFGFEISPEKLQEFFRDYNDNLALVGRALVVDSTEGFGDDQIGRRLDECDFGLLICTRTFGNHRVLRVPVGDSYGPFRPVITTVVQSTRLETNLLILSQVMPSDIVVETEYQPTLSRLYYELGLESFLTVWRELSSQAGLCLREWQMRHGASREDARETLSDLVRVIPSLPVSLEDAQEVTRGDLGFPATALPKWKGIDDLVDLGFVSRKQQCYDVVLAATEAAILRIVEYLEIDPSAYTNTPEGIAEQIENLFWNFTSNPKIGELREYVQLLDEKGLLLHHAEQEVKQRAREFSHLYDKARAKDNYQSSIKQYCDAWTRARRRRTLDGIHRSFSYLFKHYQDLLVRAVRPEETMRLAYCASAMFDTYDDLNELIQEGESRYGSLKRRLDEAQELRSTTQREAKLVIGNAEETLEIKGETDKAWGMIDETLAQLMQLHQEGTLDNEKVVELSEQVKGRCEKMRRVYRDVRLVFEAARSGYKDVHELALRASQSAYQSQVKRELNEARELDAEKQIRDLLERYQKSGRNVADAGVQGYHHRLSSISTTLKSFLARQDRLGKLNELQQDVEEFVARINEESQSTDSLALPVERIERLNTVPLFYRLELEETRRRAQGLSGVVQSTLEKFAVDNTGIDSLREEFTELEGDLAKYEESRDAFGENIRQLNYDLKTIFSPLSFHCLGATYDKFTGDLQFQLQQRVQQMYRADTFEGGTQQFQEISKLAEYADACLKGITDLDNWFAQLERDFDTGRFASTEVAERVVKLALQMEDWKKELLQRFPNDIQKALKLVESMQESNRETFEQTLGSIESVADGECENRIEEARRVTVRFEDALSSIRAQVHEMLDQALAQRKQRDFAQSLDITHRAVDTMIRHLEEVQGSRSARLQVILLSQPNLDFSALVEAYERRFGVPFDTEAGVELVELLKEGKLRATFSI